MNNSSESLIEQIESIKFRNEHVSDIGANSSEKIANNRAIETCIAIVREYDRASMSKMRLTKEEWADAILAEFKTEGNRSKVDEWAAIYAMLLKQFNSVIKPVSVSLEKCALEIAKHQGVSFQEQAKAILDAVGVKYLEADEAAKDADQPISNAHTRQLMFDEHSDEWHDNIGVVWKPVMGGSRKDLKPVPPSTEQPDDCREAFDNWFKKQPDVDPYILGDYLCAWNAGVDWMMKRESVDDKSPDSDYMRGWKDGNNFAKMK